MLASPLSHLFIKRAGLDQVDQYTAEAAWSHMDSHHFAEGEMGVGEGAAPGVEKYRVRVRMEEELFQYPPAIRGSRQRCLDSISDWRHRGPEHRGMCKSVTSWGGESWSEASSREPRMGCGPTLVWGGQLFPWEDRRAKAL